jgi:hypothetical protein
MKLDIEPFSKICQETIAIIFQHMHNFSPLYYLYPPTCFGPFGPSSGRYKLPRLQIKMRKYVLKYGKLKYG